MNALPAAAKAQLLGKTFFPGLLAGPFKSGLRIAFSISAVLMVIAALASLMRGKKYTHGQTDLDDLPEIDESQD